MQQTLFGVGMSEVLPETLRLTLSLARDIPIDDAF